ncbi:Protein of unknown function [Gryllus bimaculatus]|nr:Protein of unknown function [Gryllus bimaculatus]
MCERTYHIRLRNFSCRTVFFLGANEDTSQLQQEDQSRCNVAQERPIEISKTTSSLTRFPRFEPQTMKVNAVTSNPKGPNDKSLNEVTLK